MQTDRPADREKSGSDEIYSRETRIAALNPGEASRREILYIPIIPAFAFGQCEACFLGDN